MASLPASVGCAVPEEFGLVPEVPGVYAWYPRFSGPPSQFQRFDEALAKPPGITALVSTENGFRTRWTASVERGLAGSFTTKTKAALTDPAHLNAIWSTLQEVGAAPFLMAPLYVGEAGELRTRLQQHAKALETLNLDDIRDRHLRTFAERARRLDLKGNQLQVWYVTLARSFPARVALQDLLNRWVRPILGRR